eukprot:TRINITY_DN57794_c0_g1_i1.p1 TRINITY_DN57794_c0_g1~~TRINITY_DN57794_c0_g1_i1.p1  ORF type:complete len:919 (-),score=130.80 TRINITY_DN57794_c0_g1_i1:237-2993(-)
MGGLFSSEDPISRARPQRAPSPPRSPWRAPSPDRAPAPQQPRSPPPPAETRSRPTGKVHVPGLGRQQADDRRLQAKSRHISQKGKGRNDKRAKEVQHLKDSHAQQQNFQQQQMTHFRTVVQLGDFTSVSNVVEQCMEFNMHLALQRLITEAEVAMDWEKVFDNAKERMQAILECQDASEVEQVLHDCEILSTLQWHADFQAALSETSKHLRSCRSVESSNLELKSAITDASCTLDSRKLERSIAAAKVIGADESAIHAAQRLLWRLPQARFAAATLARAMDRQDVSQAGLVCSWLEASGITLTETDLAQRMLRDLRRGLLQIELERGDKRALEIAIVFADLDGVAGYVIQEAKHASKRMSFVSENFDEWSTISQVLQELSSLYYTVLHEDVAKTICKRLATCKLAFHKDVAELVDEMTSHIRLALRVVERAKHLLTGTVQPVEHSKMMHAAALNWFEADTAHVHAVQQCLRDVCQTQRCFSGVRKRLQHKCSKSLTLLQDSALKVLIKEIGHTLLGQRVLGLVLAFLWEQPRLPVSRTRVDTDDPVTVVATMSQSQFDMELPIQEISHEEPAMVIVAAEATAASNEIWAQQVERILSSEHSQLLLAHSNRVQESVPSESESFATGPSFTHESGYVSLAVESDPVALAAKRCLLPSSYVLLHDAKWVEAKFLRAGDILWGSAGLRPQVKAAHRELPKDRDIVVITIAFNGQRAAVTFTSSHCIFAKPTGREWQQVEACDIRPSMHSMCICHLDATGKPSDFGVAEVESIHHRVWTDGIVELELTDLTLCFHVAAIDVQEPDTETPLCTVSSFGPPWRETYTVQCRRSGDFLHAKSLTQMGTPLVRSDPGPTSDTKEHVIFQRTVHRIHDDACPGSAACWPFFEGKCKYGNSCNACHHPDHFVGRQRPPTRRSKKGQNNR